MKQYCLKLMSYLFIYYLLFLINCLTFLKMLVRLCLLSISLFLFFVKGCMLDACAWGFRGANLCMCVFLFECVCVSARVYVWVCVQGCMCKGSRCLALCARFCVCVCVVYVCISIWMCEFHPGAWLCVCMFVCVPMHKLSGVVWLKNARNILPFPKPIHPSQADKYFSIFSWKQCNDLQYY